MDISQILTDLKDLIKKKKKTIIISTAIVTLLFIVLQGLLYFNRENEEVELPASETENAAQFDIYVEHEVEGTYMNSYLIEIFMTQPEVVNEIEEATGVEIKSVLDEYNEEFVQYYTESDPINVERQRSSQVMFVTVDVGSSEDNLNVANAYYEWLETTDHEFFDNKKVLFIEEPEIVVEEDGFEPLESPSDFSILSFILQLIAIILVGIVVGIVVVILKTLFDDKIRYGFTYGWNTNDYYVSYNKDSKAKKVINSILLSNSKNKVLLSQFDLPEELSADLSGKSEFTVVHHLMDYSDSKLDEVTIIIERDKTTKEWYREQRKLLKLFEKTTIKIIEI